jgi:hypothetical protein
VEVTAYKYIILDREKPLKENPIDSYDEKVTVQSSNVQDVQDVQDQN